MKKTAAIITAYGYLLATSIVFASPRETRVTFPGVGVDPARRSLGDVISNALQIVFIFAALAVLIFLVIGAFRWITSGGDKDAISKARGGIVNALIGLALLALAFFIAVLAGQIVGIDLLRTPAIPTLNQTPTTIGPTN